MDGKLTNIACISIIHTRNIILYFTSLKRLSKEITTTHFLSQIQSSVCVTKVVGRFGSVKYFFKNVTKSRKMSQMSAIFNLGHFSILNATF